MTSEGHNKILQPPSLKKNLPLRHSTQEGGRISDYNNLASAPYAPSFEIFSSGAETY